MSELSGMSDTNTNSLKEEEMKERLLDLALDEVEDNRYLLEWDVKPYLRMSNRKLKPLDSYDPFRQLTDEDEIRAADEDVYSRPDRDERDEEAVPHIDLSNRSHHHFDYRCGKIFAFNITYEVTDEDLWTLFGTFGRLKRAAINYNQHGKSNGTAFVVFETKAEAMRAFHALDGHFLDGRKLRLRIVSLSGGTGDPNSSHIFKRRGDKRPIDNIEVFEDKEVITKDNLNFSLNEYIDRRKKAKTWNYY